MEKDKMFAFKGPDGDWHAHRMAGRLCFYCTIKVCKNPIGHFYYERRLLNVHRREEHSELALLDVKLKEPNKTSKYSRERYEREKDDIVKWHGNLAANQRRRLVAQACSKEGVKSKLLLSDKAKANIEEEMKVYDSKPKRQERLWKREQREARRTKNPVEVEEEEPFRIEDGGQSSERGNGVPQIEMPNSEPTNYDGADGEETSIVNQFPVSLQNVPGSVFAMDVSSDSDGEQLEQEVQALLQTCTEERLRLSRQMTLQKNEIEHKRKELENCEAQSDMERKKLQDEQKMLAVQMNEIEEKRKELENREAQNDMKKKKLEDDKKMISNRTEVLQKVNELQRSQEEKQQMLVEKHEKQKGELFIQFRQQKKKLADRQKLELEIECLEASIETMNQVNGWYRLDQFKKIEALQNDLKQKRALFIQYQQQKINLAYRQKLELEIERLEASIELETMNQVNGWYGLDHFKKIEALQNDLKASIETVNQVNDWYGLDHFKKIEALENDLTEKNEEMASLQDMNQQLMKKEREANDELQEARQAVIDILQNIGTNPNSEVIVKRMGDLVEKPWVDACEKKFKNDEWQLKCSEILTLWMDHVRDPNWYPFKIVEMHGKAMYLIDESDKKLKDLHREMGDEVYNSVVIALKDLIKYNGSGRYPVPELWNAKEQRRATLKEAILYLSRTWKRRTGF